MMNGLDASLELDYVLELPLERALAMRGELLSMGVPENWIKVIQPSTITIKANRGQKINAGRVVKQKMQVDNGGIENRQRTRTIRFLPNSIKLGTCSGGQYNVAMRRRTEPEGREILWISMAVAKVVTKVMPGVDQAVMTTVLNDENEDLAKNNTMTEVTVRESQDTRGGGGGDKSDEPMMIRPCNCADANCNNYKNVLRRYFIDDDSGDNDNFSDIKCIYKRIADILLVVPTNNDGECGGERGNESLDDGGGDGVGGISSADVHIKPVSHRAKEDVISFFSIYMKL